MFEVELRSLIEKEAGENHFELTDNADKIIKAKLKLNLGLSCPCHPDDTDAYCISPKCKAATQLLGHCCCNLFSNGVKDETITHDEY